jgi:hypothetical protein
MLSVYLSPDEITLSFQEVVGSNPAIYWMDVSDASYYISIEKKKNKGSQMGHTKKIFFNIKRRLLYSHVHPGLKVMKK